MADAYYNEIDAYAAQWLRNLIDNNLIAKGDVDERSIRDVAPDDLLGYTQCHFFAGVGVWSHALRLAGWPDDREVWTGFCPCQPFSAAGQRGGVDDARHLWPEFFRLIGERRPPVVFGEQVASKDGLGWLDLVHADMEGAGYALGAVDLCAAGVGAPHIRQRLWFVGERLEHTESDGRDERRPEPVGRGAVERRGAGGLDHAADARRPAARQYDGGSPLQSARPQQSIAAGGLADAERLRCQGGAVGHRGAETDLSTANGSLHHPGPVNGVWADGGLADADDERSQGWLVGRHSTGERAAGTCGLELQEQPGPTNGVWADADWLYCRDEKWRAVEPGTFPLAHGATARVGRLRAYGNAIVPQVAAEVVGAFLDARP